MAEHVSFFRARALPGKAQAVVDHMNRWEREQKSSAKGWIRTYLTAGTTNPDELMGTVVWDNADNYFANAARPEQDAWYRELCSNFTADPEWFDGTIMRDWSA